MNARRSSTPLLATAFRGIKKQLNTAVNFQINVLDSNNGTLPASPASRDRTAPIPTVLTSPSTKNANDIYILVQDAAQLNPTTSLYFVKVEVVTDPDSNEPERHSATATTLTPGGANTPGTQTGFMATPGDVDYFSIASPAANSVLWLRIGQDPAFPSPPPHRYRLEYFLYDQTGTPIATDSSSAGSQFSQNLVQIGTARLLRTPGTYSLMVRAYVDPNNQTVIPPGDLNFRYLVEAIIVPLQDDVELAGNNRIEDAKANGLALKTLGVGGSVTITGRISFVPDPDFYIVRLNGASAGPHLLHYKVTPSTAPARSPVPGSDRQPPSPPRFPPAAERLRCRRRRVHHQRQPGEHHYSAATSLCNRRAPAQSSATKPGGAARSCSCPTSRPCCKSPHPGPVDYYFLRDQLNNWADDTDYTVQVDWWNEPRPRSRSPTHPHRLHSRPPGRPACPAHRCSPASSATASERPDQSRRRADHRHLRLHGRGDDVDNFPGELRSPPPTSASTSAWDIPAPAVDQMPFDLGCASLACPTEGWLARADPHHHRGALGLIYTPDPITSWWNTGQIPLEPAYDRIHTGPVGGGDVITNFRDYACGCLETRLINGTTATMFITVFPINRQVWPQGGLPYKISVGYDAYPYAFTAMGGASQMCPTPCQFTRN